MLRKFGRLLGTFERILLTALCSAIVALLVLFVTNNLDINKYYGPPILTHKSSFIEYREIDGTLYAVIEVSFYKVDDIRSCEYQDTYWFDVVGKPYSIVAFNVLGDDSLTIFLKDSQHMQDKLPGRWYTMRLYVANLSDFYNSTGYINYRCGPEILANDLAVIIHPAQYTLEELLVNYRHPLHKKREQVN